jgi:acetyl esterase/lipase
VKSAERADTNAMNRGCRGIDFQSKRRRGLAAILVVAALALSLAASAGAATPRGGVGGGAGKVEPPGPKPQLLLFHGGSFLFEDPEFRPTTDEPAIAAGFVPHYVTYPLGNVPAAVLAARAAAKELREKVGVEHVFAYGSSAGGTLAALLSGEGLVSAAVAKAPVSDLVSWEWPLTAYGPTYDEQVGLTLADRYRLSPLRRPAESPLLVVQGRGDQVVPPAMNVAFAAKFERVHLLSVPGGHTTDKVRPFVVQDAMQWLARTARLQARAVAHEERLEEQEEEKAEKEAKETAHKNALP